MPIDYQERIAAIRKTKAEFNAKKLELRGYCNGDDHGNLPIPPVPFEPEPNHPNGNCYGFRCAGANLGRWISQHPVYIHPQSALAGGWSYTPSCIGGWRPEDAATHLKELHEKYNFVQPGIGAMNHSGPDMRIGLDLGWGGILAKLRRYRELNRPEDPAYYDGEEAVVLGTQTWIRRHVEEARRMAAEEQDPEIRANLIEIADMNEWLVDNPPRTLREACQFLAWFQSIDRMWATGGALGQLDELLRPYYEGDPNGDEHAVWCVASLFFNDTHYSQIGGPHPADGHDIASPISFVILEATHRLFIPSNIAVRVHENMNRDLLRKAVEYLLEDGTGCCYACADGLDNAYARNGVPMSIARMRAKVGCNWTALPGIEYCLQDVSRLCLIKPLLLALDEVYTHEPTDMESLWLRYADHLSIAVDTFKRGIDWHMKRHAKNSPEFILNLFAHGSVERGLDISDGGVDIYRLTTDGVGLATVADSFAAIEQRVIRERRLTWAQLHEILEKDFEGHEDVRLMLKNIARYGSGGSRADWWAQRVADTFGELVRGTPTPDGYTIIPGLFSHGTVAQLGEHLGATPNGRKAHTPISHSADPDPGFMPDGGGAPTAKSTAVASVQPKWGNTTPLQVDIDSGLIDDAGGVEAVEALILGHNALDGSIVNINVISKEDILKAHENADLYPDLVVRVTGYSAYFRSLSPEYRQQVVDRILAGR
jgi:formate C-acetyltransferase